MFKPLLAAKMPQDKTVEEVVKELQYPLLASPKLDGIRVLIHEGEVFTRKLKLVPNKHIRSCLSTREYAGLDGEILTTGADDAFAFRKTTSGVMSREGEPDFLFHVFDHLYTDGGFWKRYKELKKRVKDLDHVKLVKHELLETPLDLLEYEEEMLEAGYEGVMIRSLDGHYKFGRSTWREGILRKLTRTTREEAVVIGYEERMHNANEAKRDEIGRLKRSSHKENKIGRGDLGSLIVESPAYNKSFSIGTGFTDSERAQLWRNPAKLLGRVVTFEHRPYGNYDVPRFPAFIGFRDKRDL